MYLVVIAWIYVVLMMSVAEATNTTGTVLGALLTFVLYGLLPAALVVYLMGAPTRNKAIKKQQTEQLLQQTAVADLTADAVASPLHSAAGTVPASVAPKNDSDA